jgi:CTP:molybdopterin cytidylyltransferase MocA
VRDVIAAWRPGRIAVASYAGVRAPPTIMSPTMWRAALRVRDADSGDRGARDFLAARPDLVDEITVQGAVLDLDTPEDLSRWLAAPP